MIILKLSLSVYRNIFIYDLAIGQMVHWLNFIGVLSQTWPEKWNSWAQNILPKVANGEITRWITPMMILFPNGIEADELFKEISRKSVELLNKKIPLLMDSGNIFF